MAIHRKVFALVARNIRTEQLLDKAKPVLIHPFYHTVADDYLPHITPLYKPKTSKQFEEDIRFLLRYFQPISIDEVNRHIQKQKQISKNTFHLSFDDGLREVYETVLPLLLREGIPATLFINKDFVDNQQLFFRHKAALIIDKLNKETITAHTQQAIRKLLKQDLSLSKHPLQSLILSVTYSEQAVLDQVALLLEIDFQEYLKKEKPYLTTTELKEMQGKGFTIGAHSLNHPLFQELDESEQIRQTVESCAYVQTAFQEPSAYFSFPFSDEKISDSFFKAIDSQVDLSFGITGITYQNGGKHNGRIDMEKYGKEAKEAINKALLKYRITPHHC